MGYGKGRKVTAIVFFSAVLLVAMAASFYEFFYLNKVHSSFENYAKFRKCTVILEKTDHDGVCKTSSGEIITIVNVNGKWYLEGDTPLILSK